MRVVGHVLSVNLPHFTTINSDMKKTLLFMAAGLMSGLSYGQMMPNMGFENWRPSGDIPNRSDGIPPTNVLSR